MTKIFIAGSRRLSRLTADVKHRIDAIIEKGFMVLVGDANGADRAVQSYLAERSYKNVIVHCIAGDCRNNVANWPTKEVAASKDLRGFAYYSLKDLVMVDEAAYGLMLWDGESKGTLNNVLNLIRRKKIVVVYFAPKRMFFNIRSQSGLTELLSYCDPADLHRLQRELAIAPAPRLSLS